MRDLYSPLLSHKSWLIQEDGWNKKELNAREAQFTLGNGEICLRGILDESPADGVPGTFIAGLYDKTAAQATELVNLPNPLHFKLTVNGEKLGAGAMDVLNHKRALDMRQGLLARRTLFQDSKRRRYDYQSVRFVSMENERIVAFRSSLTPLDKDAEITVRHEIDSGVMNQGVLTEGRKRHFQLYHVFQSRDYDFLCVKTLEKGIYVAYASSLIASVGKKTVITGDPAFQIKVKKGQTITFTKIIVMGSSRDPYSGFIERTTREILEHSLKAGFNTLLERHRKAFKAQWNTGDITIQGSLPDQQAIRFNLYHLMIAAPRKPGHSNIGAKTMSGEGYRGHVFWDSDIFMVPFFSFVFPDIAKNMLLYRYDRLSAARRIAKENGFKGAQFPWESADSGEESTPDWAKDFDGSIIKVKTGLLEHHIVADVAYSYYLYYLATGDEEFLLRHGYEMFFETARFWASRVQWNPKRKGYDIRHVIGPDEFHENVNNNAYTNYMAKWNFITANYLYNKFRKSHRAEFNTMTREMGLRPQEVKEWTKIAKHLYFNFRKDMVLEQFEGYFKKSRVRINEVDEFGLPNIPVGLDLSKISRTQFVKQADVVMLCHLFSPNLSRRMKKNNFNYYFARTLHKSSLSPSVYASVGTEMGETDKAYQMFLSALYVDLKDARGGLKEGLHAASMGGVWQAVVFGFGGIRVAKNQLIFYPRLPKKWQGFSFSIVWNGHPISFTITSSKVEVRLRTRGKVRVPMTIFDKHHMLSPSKPIRLPLKAK